METWAKTLGYFKYLIHNCNMDCIIVCSGKERTGKTTLGWQSCKLIDDDFTADNVAFTIQEAKKLLQVSDKQSAIMIDEAQWMLYGRDALSSSSKWLNKTLMKIGQLNYFIWLNIPDYFSLDPYVRKFRVTCLLRTKWKVKPKYIDLAGVRTKVFETERGKFEVYGQHKLKDIYKVKDTSEEHWTYPTYIDYFSAVDPNDSEYKRYLQRAEEFKRVTQEDVDGKQDKRKDNILAFRGDSI
jgi:hypothetical protein